MSLAARAWSYRPDEWDERVFHEVFEEDVYRLRKHTLDPVDFTRGWVLDLGANVGAFTLRALDLGAPHVVAVEPVQANYEQLLSNLDACGALGQVTVIRKAVVGERHEGGTLRMAQPAWGASTRADPTGDIVVPTIQLRELLGVREWSCVKLDIEGGEYAALAGITPHDLRGVMRLTMEFHNAQANERSIGDIVGMLMEWGTVATVGRPSAGGNLHAARYGL